jgi:hypothetical protein
MLVTKILHFHLKPYSTNTLTFILFLPAKLSLSSPFQLETLTLLFPPSPDIILPLEAKLSLRLLWYSKFPGCPHTGPNAAPHPLQ